MFKGTELFKETQLCFLKPDYYQLVLTKWQDAVLVAGHQLDAPSLGKVLTAWEAKHRIEPPVVGQLCTKLHIVDIRNVSLKFLFFHDVFLVCHDVTFWL